MTLRAGPGNYDVAALQQQCRKRSTDEPATDDTGHRGGDGDRRRAGDARLLEERRKGEAGRRAAGERDRAGEDTEERLLSERQGHGGADDVLQDGDRGREDEEAQDERAAEPEELVAGTESDGGEEGVLKRRLQGRVETHELNAAAVRDGHRNRDHETAHDRRRQVEAREQRDRASQPVACEEHDPGNRDRIDEIEREHRVEARRVRAPTRPRRESITQASRQASAIAIRGASGRSARADRGPRRARDGEWLPASRLESATRRRGHRRPETPPPTQPTTTARAARSARR